MDENNEELLEEIIVEGGPNEMPSFPILIFIFAFVKDFFDLASMGFSGWFFNIFFIIILFFWMSGKVGFVRKQLMKLFVRRAILTLIVGSIPIVNFIPESMILVALTHYHEKKIVRKFFDLIEELKLV